MKIEIAYSPPPKVTCSIDVTVDGTKISLTAESENSLVQQLCNKRNSAATDSWKLAYAAALHEIQHAPQIA